MQKTVAPGQDVDESAEGGDVDHLSLVLLALLGLRREGNQVDSLHGRLQGGAVGGCDPHDPLALGLLDLDGDSRLLLEFSHHLALGTDDLADLVLGYLDRLDARRPLL